MEMTGAFGYALIGSIIGFVVGVVLASTTAAVHPLVLREWENYRKAKEVRALTTAAMRKMDELLERKSQGENIIACEKKF